MANKDLHGALENIGNLTYCVDGELTDKLLEDVYEEDFNNLRKGINDLDIYVKAFDLICLDIQKVKKVDGDDKRGQNYFRTHYLELAKKELGHGK